MKSNCPNCNLLIDETEYFIDIKKCVHCVTDEEICKVKGLERENQVKKLTEGFKEFKERHGVQYKLWYNYGVFKKLAGDLKEGIQNEIDLINYGQVKTQSMDKEIKKFESFIQELNIIIEDK